MRKIFSVIALLFAFCATALAAPPLSSVPVIAAQAQAMRLGEVVRMKVENPDALADTGLGQVRPGDELELRKTSADTVVVKHLPSGQSTVLSQPAETK